MKAHPKGRAWRKTMLLAASASVLGAEATAAHAQRVKASGSASVDAAQLEELVVTASRREASIRETPTAISAYSGQQLAKEHVETFADLATQTPNLQLGSNGANTNIAIRGIGTNLQLAGSDPGVAFHLDGVYVAEPALALLNFLDVSRVEVLRGPQGTLFGRNATGGAINIISNTPTADPAIGLDGSAGWPAGEHVSGFASGPLTGDGALLGRASFEQTYQRGAVKNLSAQGPRRLDGKDAYAGRLQLEWRPSGELSLRLQADDERSDTSGPAYYLVGTPNVAAGLPPQLAGAFIGRPDDDKIAVTRGASKLNDKAIAAFIDWKLGGGSLRATVSRRRSSVYRSYDGDGTEVDFTSTTIDQRRDSTYAELLYSSDEARRVSYILGANYLADREVQNVAVPVAGFPAPVLLFGDVTTHSAAVFGHVQYRMTDSWKLFAGARYSQDRKREGEANNFIGSLHQSDRWSKPTFEVGTSYDLSPTTTGYLKYATGYKSGGYSAGALGPPFAPETNQMWELGLKGAYFGGRTQANLALFRMSYANLQVNQVVGVTSEVTNAARATINGAELELVQELTPELEVQAYGGWLDAKFDSFRTEDSARPSLGLLDLTGNRLPNAPRFTAGLGPVLHHDLKSGGRLTMAARYDWKSQVYFSEFNLPLVSQKAGGRMSAYGTYELPGGRWQIGVYGRNLTDEHAYNSMVVSSAVLNSVTLGTLEPRREVGVRFAYRY